MQAWISEDVLTAPLTFDFCSEQIPTSQIYSLLMSLPCVLPVLSVCIHMHIQMEIPVAVLAGDESVQFSSLLSNSPLKLLSVLEKYGKNGRAAPKCSGMVVLLQTPGATEC